MRKLKAGEIRVIVRDAGWSIAHRQDRDLVYARKMSGMTVAAAIHELGQRGSMPVPDVICNPYYHTRRGRRPQRIEVPSNSDLVLQDGDVLSCDDP